MTQHGDLQFSSAPALPTARGMIRWVCTKNPFYVVSAGLFLAGLRISFGDPSQATDTWAMMSGLAGYTLLLAGAACLLVRFANVWDDVRTVLLLVVLMFLATSVTFDEVLVLTPGRGAACYLAGLAFAILVSEGILRAIRLRLPAGFRAPYYLILALFFLYPLLLRQFTDEPRGAPMLWSLYGFAPAAGMAFLLLLPAIRRGPDYVADNGSPWPWPLYPWTLFGLLALAVPARSFLLSWSMHLLDNREQQALVFGPHFMAPFGLVSAVLLLEFGLTSRRRGALAAALGLPALMVLACLIGHRPEPIYRQFLDLFAERLGGLPAFVTLLAACAFYAYAALRRAPLAIETLTAALLALGFVGPRTLAWGDFTPLQPAPWLAAAVLQTAIGVWRQASWRVLAGSLLAAAGLSAWGAGLDTPFREPLLAHALLALMMAVAAFYDDLFAEVLRALSALAILAACVFLLLGPAERLGAPDWLLIVYPVALALVLAAYAWWLRSGFALGIAAVIAALWTLVQALRGYEVLRLRVRGLDYLAMSLVFFGVAVLVSLAKAGVWPRRLPAARDR
jgi:hypothetical protein